MGILTLVLSQVSVTNSTDLKPTLLGVIDPTNAANTVTIKDIFDNKRVAVVLSNLGITLNLSAYQMGKDNQRVFATLPIVKPDVFPDAFDIISVSIDVWDIGDESTDKSELHQKISAKCPEFTNGQVEDIVERLSQDASTVLSQMYSHYAEDTSPDFNIYSVGYNLTGPQPLNLSIVSEGPLDDFNMPTPDADINIKLPTFMQLACQENYNAFVLAHPELMDNTGYTADEAVDKQAILTNYFENEESTSPEYKAWTDIYKPQDSPAAIGNIWGASHNMSKYIPIINTYTVPNSSITEFWDVVSDQPIPHPSGYKTNRKGKLYQPQDILGYPENNNTPILPNEQSFYAQALELLNIGISIEHCALSNEAYALVKDKLSPIVRDYFKLLARQAYNVNWSHTGMAQPIYGEVWEDPDDDDDERVSEVQEYKMQLPCRLGDYNLQINPPKFKWFYESETFKYITDEEMRSQAIREELRRRAPRLNLGFNGSADISDTKSNSALVGFISEIETNTCWIDTFLRLLRWGHNKPTVLVRKPLKEDGVSNTDNQKPLFWDLNSGSVVRFDGNTEAQVPIINPDTGNSFKVENIITTDLIVSTRLLANFYPNLKIDKTLDEIELKVPVGICYMQKHEGDILYRFEYEDIFTYHSKVHDPQISKGHISWDGEKYVLFGENEEITEIPLMDAVKLITKKSATADNSQVANFSVNDNADTINLLHERLRRLKDQGDIIARAEKEKSTYSLFKALQQFSTSVVKTELLSFGKELHTGVTEEYQRLGYLTSDVAHLSYMYLDKYVAVALQQPQNLLEILEAIDDIDTMYDSTLETLDENWSIFVDIMDKGKDAFTFVKYTSEAGDFLFAMGHYRDAMLQNNPKTKRHVFMTKSQYETLAKTVTLPWVAEKPIHSKIINGVLQLLKKWNSIPAQTLVKCQRGQLIMPTVDTLDQIYTVIK